MQPASNIHQKPSLISCEDFLNFFSQKIAKQRFQIPLVKLDPSSHPACIAEWGVFEPIALTVLKDIVQKLKPTFCANDMMPSRLLKLTFDSVALSITHLFNKSLSSGTYPQEFKHAVVTPRLKRPNLSQDDMKNYRPISQISFISKSCVAATTIIFK